MAERFNVYLTRWCLSQGIYEAPAYVHPTNEFWVIIADGGLRGHIMQSGDWFRTKEEAVKDAKKKLARALASARRYLAELETINFDEEPQHEHQPNRNGSSETDEARESAA